MNQSNDFVELIQNVNNNLTYYLVEPADKAMGEEGTYIEGEGVGYQLVNRATGVVEHTSIMLPGIIFQAQHFDDMLKSLLAKKAGPDSVQVQPTEDVLIN